MSHRSEWPPVYPGLHNLPDKDLYRPYAKLPTTDTSLLISIAANSAVITYIIQTEIKHLADYARLNKITFIDSERLFKYIRERSAIVATPAEAHARDVSGRGTGGGEQAQKPTGKRTGTGKGVTRGSGT